MTHRRHTTPAGRRGGPWARLAERTRSWFALSALAGVLAALVVALPAPAASAASCASGWSAGAVYTGGDVVSYGGHNWTAKWWTQGETPGTTGQWGVWDDQG